MNVLVTGDRNWGNGTIIYLALDGVRPLWVVSGGAPGADTIARQVCEQDIGCHFEEVKAEWHIHKSGAGPIRNGKMLRMLLERDGDKLVLAFNDKLLTGSKGTRNMVGQALDADVPVVLHVSTGDVYDVFGTSDDMYAVWRGKNWRYEQASRTA